MTFRIQVTTTTSGESEQMDAIALFGGPLNYTVSKPEVGDVLVWNGTSWTLGNSVGDPTGATTEIQFNDNGAFGASANLTYDGALNVKSAGSTGVTQTLRLTNSTATNLLTINDDGTVNGKNIAIGEYTAATRIGESAGLNATGSSWTALGTSAGQSNTTGSNWTALGTNTGKSNTTGNDWTAIGANAGYNNTSGSFWTAIGFDTGRSNTTGSYWTAIGLNAGYYNTTGSYWTAIGTGAGQGNTTGSLWTAIGPSAGYSNTTGNDWTALGINAGYYNTTGSSWTAIGANAGQSNTTGSFWTAIGPSAGHSNTTGSLWTAIGFNSARYQSGKVSTDLTVFNNGTYLGSETHGTENSTNETVIGYAAEGNGSNTVTIGSSAVTDNYFSGKLHATGSVQVGYDADRARAANVGAIRYRMSGNKSYAEMVMQTGASAYEWVIIRQNTW